MDYSKIKCVVVDFDNTMYSGGSWSEEDGFYDKFLEQEKFLPEGKRNVAYVMSLYPKYHSLQAIYGYMQDHGLDDTPFRKFEATQIYNFIDERTVFIEPALVTELAKYYKVYLLSDSSKEYLDKHMKTAGIRKKDFVKVMSNQYIPGDLTKTPMMKQILKETKLKPEEIVMVGDSELCDKEPAEKLGFQTFVVDNVFDTSNFFEKLIAEKRKN